MVEIPFARASPIYLRGQASPAATVFADAAPLLHKGQDFSSEAVQALRKTKSELLEYDSAACDTSIHRLWGSCLPRQDLACRLFPTALSDII